MDRRRVAKKPRRRRKKNMDIAQQSKEPVYFPNDTILEAAKFLTYEKWSQLRFLCQRVNQLIQSNQSKLQAFEVRSLSMEKVLCKSNSIISFNRGIQSPVAMRKWFQDRGYSCDETTDIPLEKVFAGLNLYEQFNPNPGVRVDVRAYFDEPTEKSMPLTRGQAKRTGKAHKKNRYLPNAARSELQKVFSAKFNHMYDFYGPILSHFFRLLHHPTAYFREVSMFPPMTDKFCDMLSHSRIRCDKFTLMNFDCSLEHSLKWLKDNVRAQQIILSFSYSDKIPYLGDLKRLAHSLKWLKDNVRAQKIILSFNYDHAFPNPDLHSLLLDFVFQDASISVILKHSKVQ
ncbi:hypothetical protein DdX_20038 [Ditylenchus destructor]|uniref:Uncharacterized protein n=1 Tax=Ditylenchus destructor TaxID=166010 RepID=A0AAD4QTV5_9BILA|nr:hypothetical protein DdX_20038 [Ditylenchus destructor]